MASGGESDTGSLSSAGKTKSKRDHSREKKLFVNQNVPMIKRDDLTFSELQKRRLKDMEKKMEDEMRRKKKEWEREVEKMRDEFLKLYPSDKEWGSEELISDPLVYRRKGSIDVLDKRKMKTLFMEYPDSGRRYKIRFDVSDYEPESVEVTADSDIIKVTAIRCMEVDGKTVRKEYSRKLERPSKVDPEKLKSYLTKDGILIVEAPLPPHSLNLRKASASPSHSSISTSSTRSRSPSNSPHTPSGIPKIGIPIFTGKNGERRMHLILDIGKVFGPKDTSVHALKENRIIIKAKHEERTSERFSKNKYSKEFELSEKIDPYTLRAGLTDDGKLIIGALGKHTDAAQKAAFTKDVVEEIAAKATPCNVLALASFPPVTPST